MGHPPPTIYCIGARAHAHALAQLSWETSDAILKLYTYFSRISGANHISPPDVRLRSREKNVKEQIESGFSLYFIERRLFYSVFITFLLFITQLFTPHPPPPTRA